MNILTFIPLFLASRLHQGLYYDLWTPDLQLTEREVTEVPPNHAGKKKKFLTRTLIKMNCVQTGLPLKL